MRHVPAADAGRTDRKKRCSARPAGRRWRVEVTERTHIAAGCGSVRDIRTDPGRRGHLLRSSPCGIHTFFTLEEGRSSPFNSFQVCGRSPERSAREERAAGAGRGGGGYGVPPRVIPPRSGAWDDTGEGHNRGFPPLTRLSGSAMVKFVMISICTVPPAEGIILPAPGPEGWSGSSVAITISRIRGDRGGKRHRRAPCDRVSPFIDPGRVPPGVDAGQFSAGSVAAPIPKPSRGHRRKGRLQGRFKPRWEEGAATPA